MPTLVNPTILIEEMPFDIFGTEFKKGDYVVSHLANFYNGAGIYHLIVNGVSILAKCIEMADGKIQYTELGTTASKIMEAKEFCRAVQRRVFARILLENNLPAASISEFRRILMRS